MKKKSGKNVKLLLFVLSVVVLLFFLFRGGSEEHRYKKLGLNTEHLFIIDDCSMTYNGKPFMVGQTIEELLEVFGPYDRVISNLGHTYLWDEIGISITTASWDNPDTNQVNNIYLHWNLDMSDDSYPTQDLTIIEMRKTMVEHCPRNYFKGNILLGGAALGRGMKIGDFIKRSHMKWTNPFFPVLYKSILKKCTDLPITDNECIKIVIRVSRDYSNIECLIIGSVGNNVA